MYKIAKEHLGMLFARLSRKIDLFLPIKKDNQVNFGLWSEDAGVDIETLKTTSSPKSFFLPQFENLYSTTMQSGQIHIEPVPFAGQSQDRSFAVFGVRACDRMGIELMDDLFLGEPVDRFYKARRSMGSIITLSCSNPLITCLCKSFGVDAANPGGDVDTWLIEGMLYWKAQTEAGLELTEEVLDLLKPINAADEAIFLAEQEAICQKIDALPYSDLSLGNFNPDNLLKIFDAPEWDSLHKACLACGTCTFVCPTCFCYDIMDFDAGRDIKRYRCWDSCMYSDFTMMAHGNPRNTQKERFRNRFMHKLVYHTVNHEGQYSCVGCGRCISKCPVSLHIIKVIKSLGVKEFA